MKSRFSKIQLNLSTTVTLEIDESGQRCREVQTRVNAWTVCQKKAFVERWPLYRGSNKSQCMDCLPKKGLCREVATVQRFKQESMYGLSAKKMAVVERWPLVDVRLYIIMLILCPQNCYRKGLLYRTKVHV